VSTKLNINLSAVLQSTIQGLANGGQGLYVYAAAYDANGLVPIGQGGVNYITLVDGLNANPTVPTTETSITLPSALNGGKIYLIIQSVAAGDQSGLFGPGGAINQESDINWNNAASLDFRYDSFEVSLLGAAGDAGNLTDVNVFGIPMSVDITYPNGATSQTRGYKVNGESIFNEIAGINSGALVHQFTEGPLAGTSRLAAAPATALAPGGPGGASAADWTPYVESLGAAVVAGTVDMRIAGFFNGAYTVDYVNIGTTSVPINVQYQEYHNAGLYDYTVSYVAGTGNAGTYVLSPTSASQIKGTIEISTADLSNSIYATLGNAQIKNPDGSYYQFSGLNNAGQIVVSSDMNTGANNEWGAAFVKLLTGFIGGYMGGTATPLNSLLGTDPINLSQNWNFDPTFAFGGQAGAGQPGAVTPFTWSSSTFGTGVSHDPYAEIFFDNTNSYGNGYSDAVMSLFQQGGPLIPTGYSIGLGNNPFATYTDSLGANPLTTYFDTLGSNPLSAYTGTFGANPFSTTNGSAVITVTDANAASYAVVGSSVAISGVTTGFAGLSAAQLNQTFKITSVDLANNSYTIQIGGGASANATTTGGGTGVASASNVITVTDADAADYAIVGSAVTIAGVASGFSGFTTAQLNNTFKIIGVDLANNTYQVAITNGATAVTATSAGTGGGSSVTSASNVITVLDANAADYAAVGGYVSFIGAGNVGGIAAGQLIGPLQILKVVDSTHYQVGVTTLVDKVVTPVTATSAATGGGSGIVNQTSALTVTDANAADYAEVGALVSFGGVSSFAGIPPAALNATFTITKIIDATHYQVQLNNTTANRAEPGGGSAVVAGVDVQEINLTLFADKQTAVSPDTLAETQGYTPTVIYNTYDSNVGPLVAPLESTGAPNLSLILGMGVGQLRVDPDATVTLGFYTGTTDGLATFTQAAIPTPQNLNFSLSNNPLASTAITLGANPFSTQNTSNVITVFDVNASKYAVVGSEVAFTGATAVGGFTVTQLNQTFTITSVDLANNTYQVQVSGAVANATTTGGGAAIAGNSNVIIVFDPNAGSYAMVPGTTTLAEGASVTLSGATGFAGVDASALNQTFEIKGIVDGAHYLVQVSEIATSGTTGGGQAVVGNAHEPRYQTWLYNENLVLENPFTAVADSGVITVTDVNADLYAKVGAQVTFGGATGFAGIDSSALNTTFTIATVVDSMHYTINLAGGATATSDATGGGAGVVHQDANIFTPIAGVTPTGSTLQLNGLPYGNGVNWYQLSISHGGVSRTYNMYMEALAGSGILNPQYAGANQAGSIALDNLAALPAVLPTSQYLTSVNVGLFNGGTVSLDPALLAYIGDAAIQDVNSGANQLWPTPNAPVLGLVTGSGPDATFTNWTTGGTTPDYQLNTPNSGLGSVTTANVAFGWWGADQQWVGFNAYNGGDGAAPIQVIGGYTNKVYGSDLVKLTFTSSTSSFLPTPQTLAADIDGKWIVPVSGFTSGDYTVTMTEYLADGVTQVGPSSGALNFTVALSALAFANTSGANFLELDSGGTTAGGSWIQLQTTGSSMPNGTLLAFATDALGNMIGRDGSITTDLSEAVLAQIGSVAFDNGTVMQTGTQSVFLPVGQQLHFAVQTGNNTIEQLPGVQIAGTNSLSISVNGGFGTLNLQATVDNTLSASANLAASQRDYNQPWAYLTQGQGVNVEVAGSAWNMNTIHFVHIDVNPATSAWSVGGVAYGNTDAFRSAVANSWDPGFAATGGRGDFGGTTGWTPSTGTGFYAPVLATEGGDIFVIGNANVDGQDHIRMFGQNTFGFEDLRTDQNSDFDYNDVVVRLTLA